MSDPRRDELAANLSEVRAGLAAATRAAGRPPGCVTLVAVTKTWPAQDVRRLASLGVTDVGENRDQEAAEKTAELADLSVRWHFIGQLQTNKARSVARYADVVHAVDRPRLVAALDRAATDIGRRVRVLLQASLAEPASAEAGRGGARPQDISSLAEQVVAAGSLELGGVMGVAPLGDDPDRAFARLAEVAAALQALSPNASWVSAGMSHDFAAAIRHGATHVRIGSALLGNRPALR